MTRTSDVYRYGAHQIGYRECEACVIAHVLVRKSLRGPTRRNGKTYDSGVVQQIIQPNVSEDLLDGFQHRIDTLHGLRIQCQNMQRSFRRGGKIFEVRCAVWVPARRNNDVVSGLQELTGGFETDAA